MNTSENFRDIQNPSEAYSSLQKGSERATGIGRGKKYPGAEIPEGDVSKANFSLIMEEAYAEFERKGERRSVRMIAEYCKTGELVCYYDSDDKRWHLTPESVQQKISKIKSLNVRKPQGTSEALSEDLKSSQRTSQPHGTHETQESTGNTNEEGRTLRAKVRRMEVEADVNKRYIEKLEEEREKFIERMISQSHQIGSLEKENEQLQNLIEAPKRNRVRPIEPPVSNERDAEFTEVET